MKQREDDIQVTSVCQDAETDINKLNYWLLQNLNIMESLTIKEPVSWSEQDWGS